MPILQWKAKRTNALWQAFAILTCLMVSPLVELKAAEDMGFEATIDGAYDAEVTGKGVLVFLAEAGFDKRGYYFLADGQGLRPHGITFVLPRDVGVGQHALTSPSPFDIGTVVSVRIDRDVGDGILSAQDNTNGYLDLQAFPKDASHASGPDVVGYFSFATETAEGEPIMVRGRFAFQAD